MKVGRYRIKINVSSDGTIEITIEPIPRPLRGGRVAGATSGFISSTNLKGQRFDSAALRHDNMEIAI
jgi:hypothetical protein